MKKALALLATLVATLTLTSTADARAKAPGEMRIYGFPPVTSKADIVFGQLFSSRASCVGGRKFEFVLVYGNKHKTVDSGKTSEEGGISSVATDKDFEKPPDDGILVVAKTRKCAKVTLSLASPMKDAAAARRATAAAVVVASVRGLDDDGAVAGIVTSSKEKCVKHRKVKLRIDGVTTDEGTTTKDGGFALHIEIGEFTPDDEIEVVMSKSKGCGAGSGQVPQPVLNKKENQ